MRRFYLSLMIVFILFPIFLSAQTTRSVPSQYSTIQDAVNSSIDGDIVMIASGIYYENVDLHDRILTFIGSNSLDGTIIDGNQLKGIFNISRGSIFRNLTFRNCIGGIWASGYGFIIEVIDCHFMNNVTGIQSSSTVEDRIINCIFNDNSTGYSHVYYGSDSYISNCTFANNSIDIDFTPGYATTAKLEVYNTILRDDVHGTEENYVLLHYSNYVGAKIGANVQIKEGCIEADPQFINSSARNYQLLSTSPCINAGSPNSFYKDFNGTRNDIGFTGGRRIFLNRLNFDYGYTAVNRTKDLILDIVNFSGKSLVISSVDTGNYQISTDAFVPITIPANSRKPLTFTIQQTSAGLFSSTIKINFSNDTIVSDLAEFSTNSFCVSYSGGVIKVPSQAPTIQAAIDVSLNGETVLLDPNIYLGNILIVNKNIKILGNDFAENIILDGGGKNAITVFRSNLEIKSVTIKNSNYGIFASTGALINIYNSIFLLNSYAILTSALTPVNIYNSLLHHNTIGLQISYYLDRDNYIINSTFSNNVDDIKYSLTNGPFFNMYIYNSIVRGGITSDNGSIFLNYCNYDPQKTGTNVVIQTGNQTANPIFINTPSGNYRLDSTSPCINAGTIDTTGLNLPSIDLDNNKRIWQGRVDIGAYEYGSPLVGITSQESTLPNNYQLYQNYPNPFNPTTTIKFGLPENTMTKLIVYDILGREVSTLINKELEAGFHEVNFDGSKFSSGVYSYRLSTPKFISVKKLLLMK